MMQQVVQGTAPAQAVHGRPREDGADLQPAGAAAVTSVRPAPAPAARASSPPGPGSLTATQRRLGRDWRLAALFLAPTAVLVGGLVLVPIARSIVTSTTERHGQDSVFVGLDNYIALVGDEQFHTGVVNSFVFTAYAEVFKVVLGLAAALLLHHRRRGRAVLAGLLLLPWVVPTVVTAFSWRVAARPDLRQRQHRCSPTPGSGRCWPRAHLVDSWPAGWLSDPSLAMPSVILVNVWKGVPFFTVDVPRRVEGHPGGPLRGGDRRRRLVVAAVRPRDAARTAPRDHRDGDPVVDLDVQQLRPHLVADAGRPGRRDRAVRAGRLLEGDPAAAVRRGRGGHARDAADHRRAGVRPGPVVAPGHRHQAARRPGRRGGSDARWAGQREGAAVGRRRGGHRSAGLGVAADLLEGGGGPRGDPAGRGGGRPGRLGARRRGAVAGRRPWCRAWGPGSRWPGCSSSCSARCTGSPSRPSSPRARSSCATDDLWPTPWTLEQFGALFTNQPFGRWYLNTAAGVRGVHRGGAGLRRPGRLRAGPAAVPRGAELHRHGAAHLRDAGRAAVHPAVPAAHRGPAHRLVVVAGGDVPDLHAAVRHLAAGGLLRVDPRRAGGGRAGRRLHPRPGVRAGWCCRWPSRGCWRSRCSP